MADPLSIAASVIGITAAGVQASVKLYALAEKVATASQRITSIADDISSTCAILNQVRQLIIPQPDAQGVLKSVFNSVALKDISNALQRCRAVFTEIGTLLRRAFEQVGKRPALHSNIELSMSEKAKWPFLQPQFDDLRSDLRDAKGNLVLMIAVATLALAQRDGRQRPIYEMERLEIGSTIVQLEQARRTKPDGPAIHTISEQPRDITNSSGENVLGSQSANLMEVTPPSSQQNADPPLLFRMRKRGVGSIINGVSLKHFSSAPPGDGRSQEQGILNRSSPAAEIEATTLAKLPPDARSITSPGSDLVHESRPSNQTFLEQSMASRSGSRSAVTTQLPTSSTSSTSEEISYYQGWYTEYLQGLTTGYGNSITLNKMKLPEQSLRRMVKAYVDEGHDPHIRMLELTKEQQEIIKKNCLEHSQAEVVYVHVQRNITISSVFGMMNIETLKWIIKIKRSPGPASPIAPGSMTYVPGPLTSFRRRSAMKTLFMKLVGARRKDFTRYTPPPDDDKLRQFPEIPGETHRMVDSGDYILASRIETLPNGEEENYSVPSRNHLRRYDTLEVPKFVHVRRESTPIPLSPEENGEDIVEELLARWITL